MEIIKTKSITKHFGQTVAADNISIQVNQSEIYGFLGLNGAGKTTLIRMLLGMIKPDSGTVTLDFSQVIAATGYGTYFPWSIPGLYSGAGGEYKNLLDPLSYIFLIIKRCRWLFRNNYLLKNSRSNIIK